MIAYLALAISCAALLITVYRELDWGKAVRSMRKAKAAAISMETTSGKLKRQIEELILLRQKSEEADREAAEKFDRHQI